jgi:hypothetical protein
MSFFERNWSVLERYRSRCSQLLRLNRMSTCCQRYSQEHYYCHLANLKLDLEVPSPLWRPKLAAVAPTSVVVGNDGHRWIDRH